MGSSLYRSVDGGQSFTKSSFESAGGSISSVQSLDDNVFVTFGYYHEICEWNKILISRDGGVKFFDSAEFGDECDSYSRITLTKDGVFVSNASKQFLSVDGGNTFALLDKLDERWIRIQEQNAREDRNLAEKFFALNLPERRSLKAQDFGSGGVSYTNKDFNRTAPATGIIYYFTNSHGATMTVDANDIPRRVWFDAHDDAFYYYSFNGLYKN